MGYIKFDKQQLINLEYSLSKEMIRSNRAGSFSCTTIIGCNTRKYHGLLICPQPTLDGDKHVLLSKVDETIIQHNAEFNIGVNRYPGTYNPKGHKYVRDFFADVIPVLTIRVGGVVLSKETMFVTEEEMVLIRYTLLEAHSPTSIRLKPFLAYRSMHRLSNQNIDLETRYDEVPNGIRTRMYPGYSNLHMQFSKKTVEYTHVPDWYKDLEYTLEKERGYEHNEDLYVPGFFEADIKKGESIIFCASTREVNPSTLSRLFTNELKRRTPRSTFENCLGNSAQQFIHRHDGKTDIIAGFPWYDRMGRYTFISLPGLSLEPTGFGACKAVLQTMVTEMKGPFFPESGRGLSTSYDSADTSLWYFWALQHCMQNGENPDRIWKTHGKHIRNILEEYAQGTSNGIKMRDNGLIYIDPTSPNMTWMNAEVNGKPVTPRYGYVVEVNALWYNAICFAIELAGRGKNVSFLRGWRAIAEKIEKHFPEIFWNKENNCLSDFVTDSGTNQQIRPNQILATSLPYSPIDEKLRRKVIDTVRRELLTPRGLRSLSPKDPQYKGRYFGNELERNQSFHQGTVWPWLLGHYAEGFLKLYGAQGLEEIRNLYHGFEETMMEDGIGTVSEIYEGDPPHAGCGAISFAPSVAELMRIQHLTNKIFSEEMKKQNKKNLKN
ncbi:MAG: amylo-alpha-1,6-glucosidase [Bacteroides sp.]|jgi:predicted glycogen debranching enzyme|nr:amylo-alpha-1,6-glucosidase [Bacteroides sp.]